MNVVVHLSPASKVTYPDAQRVEIDDCLGESYVVLRKEEHDQLAREKTGLAEGVRCQKVLIAELRDQVAKLTAENRHLRSAETTANLAADKVCVETRQVLGAKFEESTVDAARRVMADMEKLRDPVYWGSVRVLLNARLNESVVDALRRVVKERDQARANLADVYRKAMVGDCQLTRKTLGASVGEHTNAAAIRIVVERDKALAERDGARADAKRAVERLNEVHKVLFK